MHIWYKCPPVGGTASDKVAWCAVSGDRCVSSPYTQQKEMVRGKPNVFSGFCACVYKMILMMSASIARKPSRPSSLLSYVYRLRYSGATRYTTRHVARGRGGGGLRRARAPPPPPPPPGSAKRKDLSAQDLSVKTRFERELIGGLTKFDVNCSSARTHTHRGRGSTLAPAYFVTSTALTVRRSRSRSRSHRGAAAGRQHAAHNAPVDVGAVPAQLHGTPQAAQLLVTWDPDEG